MDPLRRALLLQLEAMRTACEAAMALLTVEEPEPPAQVCRHPRGEDISPLQGPPVIYCPDCGGSAAQE